MTNKEQKLLGEYSLKLKNVNETIKDIYEENDELLDALDEKVNAFRVIEAEPLYDIIENMREQNEKLSKIFEEK